MNLPLLASDLVPLGLELIAALVLGFGFGFVLESAGFGNAHNIVGQFYLNNMRVFKVMFGAVVTTAGGIGLLATVGIVDLGAIYIPETFVGPHLVGGLLLGAGMVVSGYCPGTCVAAAGSGHLDGWFTIGGVALGSILYGELYPLLSEFHVSSSLGVLTLDEVLGVGLPVLVAVVAVMAVGLFYGAEKVEALVASRQGIEKELSWNRQGIATLAGLLTVAVLSAGIFLAVGDRTGPSVTTESDLATLTVPGLASRVIDDPRDLYLVDLREDEVCQEGEDGIPYAICFETLRDDLALMPSGRLLVLFGAADLQEDDLPAEVHSYPGPKALLAGGYQAWDALIMDEDPDEALIASLGPGESTMVPALHAYFTGAGVKVKAQAPRPKIKRVRPTKSGGCS